MVHKTGQNATDSPCPKKTEVTEIDSSLPFQSVKDVVTQLDEGSFSEEKPAVKKEKPHSAERIFARETQLHLAQKELNTLKEQLKNVETTKAEALVELEKAKRTVHYFTQKLKACGESRELEIKVTKVARRSQAKQLDETNSGKPDGINCSWKEELETAVKGYASVVAELGDAKQELWKMRQEYNSAFEARVSAFKQVAEDVNVMKMNTESASELSRENSAVQESIERMEVASMQAQQLEAKVLAEKDVNPELTKNLEAQLAKTVDKIEALRKEMENKKNSELDYARSIIFVLNDANKSLQKVTEEKISLRSLVETLKLELENVKREHSEFNDKESETESVVEDLQVKLQTSKFEYEACFSEESKVRGVFEEMILTLNQLSSETENGRRDADDMKNKALGLKKKAEVSKLSLEDAKKKLRLALEEAEVAKAAEASALDHIKDLSEMTSTARSTTPESDAKVTISTEEFELLSHKVEESNKLADMKVAAAMAQVEAVKASENEALKRLEAIQKEINDMKTTTQEAMKRAEMAESARMAVESELRRWREREQKKATEAASRLFETQASSGSYPQHYSIQKQNPPPITDEVQKLEKEISASKKKLVPKISSIFHRKKDQVDRRSVSLSS